MGEHKHRTKITTILQNIPDTTLQTDPDWTSFLTNEIICNLDVISTPEKLCDIIGENLSEYLLEGNALEECCKHIFLHLKKEKIIRQNYLEKEAEEETKEEEEEEIDVTSIKMIEDDVDGGATICEGCCLMCEREMPLTKHHVIPKEVHEFYKKHHGMTKEQLHQGIMICRSCHSAVHSFHDNKTLGAEYNTLEAILADPKVQKFLPYIRRKQAISRGDKRTLKPNGPRDLPPQDDTDD